MGVFRVIHVRTFSAFTGQGQERTNPVGPIPGCTSTFPDSFAASFKAALKRALVIPPDAPLWKTGQVELLVALSTAVGLPSIGIASPAPANA